MRKRVALRHTLYAQQVNAGMLVLSTIGMCQRMEGSQNARNAGKTNRIVCNSTTRKVSKASTDHWIDDWAEAREPLSHALSVVVIDFNYQE